MIGKIHLDEPCRASITGGSCRDVDVTRTPVLSRLKAELSTKALDRHRYRPGFELAGERADKSKAVRDDGTKVLHRTGCRLHASSKSSGKRTFPDSLFDDYSTRHGSQADMSMQTMTMQSDLTPGSERRRTSPNMGHLVRKYQAYMQDYSAARRRRRRVTPANRVPEGAGFDRTPSSCTRQTRVYLGEHGWFG